MFAAVVNEESITASLPSRFAAAWRSNLFPHHRVGTSKRCHALESRFFEHRYRSMSRHIPERLPFPIGDGITLRDPATLSFYGFENSCQCNACDAAPPIFSVHHKTSDAPEFSGFYFWVRHTMRTQIVDARQLLSQPALTPTHRLAVRVNQDSVRAALGDEFFLLSAIPSGSQFPCRQPLILGQRTRTVKMHAKAMVPPISLREKFHEIGPSLLRKFFRGQLYRCTVRNGWGFI
jgi:hypothetical protein